MNAKLTIPPELVEPLRDGLFFDLQGQVDETGALVEPRRRGDIRGEVGERLARADATRRVLDVVGWYEPEEGPPPVEVDVREHREALLRALKTRLESDSDVAADGRASKAEKARGQAACGAARAPCAAGGRRGGAMSAAVEPLEEMRRFEPVSETVVLAAIDRAERHGAHRGEGATMSTVAEHLGFVHASWTTRGLRPRLEALVAAGALERMRRHGLVWWALTEKGRRRAARARRTVALPESPQHRAWRRTREEAVERIDGLREEARGVIRSF